MSFPLLKKLTQDEISGWKANRKYPLLFITAKNGRERVWACWVEGDVVYRTDGFVDGKLKEPQTHQYSGNTLRSGEEQAPLEAEKLWLKQINRGYLPAKGDKVGQKVFKHVKGQLEQNGGMNRGVKMFGKSEIIAKSTAGAKKFGSQHEPMLAKHYKNWKKVGGVEEYGLTNQGKAVEFPAIAQGKVDGMRGLPYIDKNKVVLESRKGNGFVYMDHIRNEVYRWLTKKNCKNVILDGEFNVQILYRDKNGNPTFDYTEREMTGVERYQFISEVCKITRNEPHKFEHMVEFWVFDIWDPTKTNMERWEMLEELFEDYDGDIIKIVPTRIVNSHEEIEEFMSELVGETTNREGYEFEGLMVRQANAKYIPSKKNHQDCLLKYKRFADDEWEVCGAERCNGGTQDGSIKWICKKVIDGKEKKVVAKQTGNSEDSKKLYTDYLKNPKKYNGRMINIRYNDTTLSGVPRFPRATAFVEDK